MAMLRGQEAYEEVGIPKAHAEVFQEVADRTGNVITCRAVGKYATGLIEEGYASKGFHNKAKSCNWGPMAGFVLDDPRFTKVGGSEPGTAGQRTALNDALHDGAVKVPLFISETRRKWLLNPSGLKPLIQPVNNNSDTYFVYGHAPWGLSLLFRLQRARPLGATQDMWQVMYRSAERQSAGARDADEKAWTPVMAIRDPKSALSKNDYRAATTGDYDLFAIWAAKSKYRPDGFDRRMVGHAQLESNIKSGLKGAKTGEHEHLGNVTNRITMVRNRLNEGFRRRGYTGGSMVHHSDEGGRPFVGDVDLPVFAVVPGTTDCYALKDIGDLRQFITQELAGEYAPVFSPGWMKQLVLQDRNGGFVSRDELMAKAGARLDKLGFKEPEGAWGTRRG